MDVPEIILKTIIKVLAEAEAKAKAEIEAEAKAEGLSEAEAEAKDKVKVFAKALVLAEDEIEEEIDALKGLPKAGLEALAENLPEVEVYAKHIADAIIFKAKIVAKYNSL